jgi:radical SAM superfamily enzyme YgiQ (UPF0313 family)
MEAQWYRNQGHEVHWGTDDGRPYDKVINKEEGLPFLSLPHPDRRWTRYWEYQDNGNFKYHPGTYIMSANGCWHGKCTFCVEKEKKWEVREVDDVHFELFKCSQEGFKEVFDDSGTFPIGEWLEKFCKCSYGLTLGCNMRMVDVDYKMMKRAGFRMLLFGLESANQHTLDRINKGVKVEDYKYIIKAAKAGLDCHVAVMFGYPWETDADSIHTIELVHYLLRKGFAKTAQASLYKVGGQQSNTSQRRYTSRIYDVWKYPDFWFNKLKDIKNAQDIKYLWKQIKVGLNEIR